MAGIGFELQRVLRRGGIGAFVQVVLAGAMISAGPWLLSVAAIFLVSRISTPILGGGQRLFLGIVSHSFAAGLLLFGGSHYVLTRVVADYVYEDNRPAVGSVLVRVLFATAAVSGAVALAAVRGIRPSLPGSLLLLHVGCAALFVLVNLNWVLLIFATLLRRFARIFLVYALGMAAALAGVAVLAPRLGLAGAILGFDLGQLVIVAALSGMTFHSFPPSRERLPLIRAFGRFRNLFLSGTLYYWGIWVDKIVVWFTAGRPYPGTFIRTFEPYDIPVFFASLALIPGMVYFMVIAETQFFVRLKIFLKCLRSAMYRDIQEKKYRLLRSAVAGFREQSVLQGIFTVVLIVGAREIAVGLLGGVQVLTLRLTFAAVFFHLSYLTLLIYLYYFQVYARSALLALLYFVVNLAVSLALAAARAWALAPLAYLAAGMVATGVGLRVLHVSARSLDRLLYASYG